MFSPQPSADAVRTRSRVRRQPRGSTQDLQNQASREGSVASSIGRAAKEESVGPRRGKLLRKEDSDVTETEKKNESTIWTKNTKYAVSLLPALPDCVKRPGSIVGAVDPRHRHALVVNHTSAWVWKYSDNHTLPHTYSFLLPQDEAHTRDAAYPLGTLVSPSANSDEPGLVVVMRSSGRIAYWESVGSAAAEGLFAKRRGVEGKLQLSPGETVTSICSIEPAGFVLSISSGNLAHLALRDTAGRPGITITPLRDTGFMSGLRGVLRAGARRDIVAVRAGRTGKMGDREVVVATSRCGFSKWYVQRGGNYETKPEADLREAMIKAVEKEIPATTSFRENFLVLDVAIVSSTENDTTENEPDTDLCVLAAYGGNDENTLYTLLEVTLKQGGRGDIKAVHPIKCYTMPVGPSTYSKPRLYTPKPRNTAFIVFPKAVVVLSNLKSASEGTPQITDDMMDVDRQLLAEESQEERLPLFEDVIDFRRDAHIDIVGSGGEDVKIETFRPEGSFGHSTDEPLQKKKVGNPGVVLIARGAGVLRIEAFDADESRGSGIVASPEAMVKSKIEQAVFFGHIGQNPLNFAGRKEVQFPLQEVENAALKISSEILTTSSTYIAQVLPSMEAHLELRSKRLRALAEHLRNTYKPLSAATRWRLMQDAEKCEAAKALWISYDERNASDQGTEDILSHVIGKYMLEPSNNENTDDVRLWFLKNVDNVGTLIQRVKSGLREKSSRGRRESLAVAAADREANDYILQGLGAAFGFRLNAAGLYGFDDLVDEKGILLNSKGFTAPWTSDLMLIQALDDFFEFSNVVLKSLFGGSDHSNGKEVIDGIASQMEKLVELLCRVFSERVRWVEQQDLTVYHTQEAHVKERFMEERGRWIKSLVGIGRQDAAYQISEKYQDFRTLVELACAELTKVETTVVDGMDADEKLKQSQDKVDLIKRLESYLHRFRAPFANQLYEYQVENGRFEELLGQFKEFQTYLTKFLHSSDRYAKLSWIHDVSLKEYHRAGQTLEMIANQQEEKLWNMKVELSIAKLCQLAALSEEDAIRALDSSKDWHRRKLTVVGVQEELTSYLKQYLRGAIDHDAEVEIALKEKGRGVNKRLATRSLFVRGLGSLLNGNVIDPELLIDLLTLMDGGDAGGGEFPQFYMALVVLRELDMLSEERRKLAEQAIWRRCYIQDDWVTILDTKRKTDEDSREDTRNTALYQTLKHADRRELFSGPNALRQLSPQECLFPDDACADDLRVRFSQSDDTELQTLVLDFDVESKALARLMRKTALSDWASALMQMVRDDAEEAPLEEGDIEMEM